MPPPIRLPSSSSHNSYLTRITRVRRLQDLQRLLLSSTRLASLPLRIRPFFLLLTFLTLLLLSLLGFHPTLATHLAPPSVPFSDKVLHFLCFAGATCGFYSIWLVDESVRRIWAWRWFNELVSGLVCCFIGGVMSEFVQSLLPYKTFQIGDVIANLLGSGLALYLSSKYAQERRREKELRRLYVRMDEMDDELDSDEDREEGGREGLLSGRSPTVRGERTPREMEEGFKGKGARRDQVNNPWDDGEDEGFGAREQERNIFGLGGDEDEEEDGEDKVDQSSSSRRR